MSTAWDGQRQPIPRSTRRRILRRDGGVCQLCGGARCGNHPLHVDHRTPVAEGGSDTDDNLWAIGAEPCHAEKTATEQARGRTRRQRNATRPAERHPGLR
jgi:5-methylcytosine-specific restriction enzyme A